MALLGPWGVIDRFDSRIRKLLGSLAGKCASRPLGLRQFPVLICWFDRSENWIPVLLVVNGRRLCGTDMCQQKHGTRSRFKDNVVASECHHASVVTHLNLLFTNFGRDNCGAFGRFACNRVRP